MIHLPISILAPMLMMVLWAAVTDLRSRRIPNWLTGMGVLVAISIHSVLEGWSGLRFSALGLAAAFTLYFVLYAIRALGAGDVKLMAAVGAFAGAAIWMQLFVATAIIGAVAAVVLAFGKGRLRMTLWNSFFIAVELVHFRAPHVKNGLLDVRSPASLTLPHGVAIALGVLACVVLPTLGL